MVANNKDNGEFDVDILQSLDCTDFMTAIMEGFVIQLTRDGVPMELNLYTVIGQGVDMVALFRGANKARLSVKLLCTRVPAFRTLVEEIYDAKNQPSEWGFSDDVLSDEGVGGADTVAAGDGA